MPGRSDLPHLAKNDRGTCLMTERTTGGYLKTVSMVPIGVVRDNAHMDEQTDDLVEGVEYHRVAPCNDRACNRAWTINTSWDSTPPPTYPS